MAAPVWATNDVPDADDFNKWFQNVNFALKTGTQSVTSSTTLVTDNDLSVNVDANALYVVQMQLAYDGLTTADIKVLLRCPTSATFVGMSHALIAGATGQQDYQGAAFGENASLAWGCLGAGSIVHGRISGLLDTAGTSGNIHLEWAQNTSQGTATNVRGNSFLDLKRVG